MAASDRASNRPTRPAVARGRREPVAFPPGPAQTWPVAALALVIGFAVADITGVRPLGGLVLVLGALWCGLRWTSRRGFPVAVMLVVVFLGAFVLSHVLADPLSAWPSVFLVSAITALVVWRVADR